MTTRHYDVVVLGRSLGALTAAALLARREFRVLVLGHGGLPSSYRFEQRRLRRRAFTFLCAHSPVWRKVLHDLAQSQAFSRRLTALDPMFSLLAADRRLELPPDRDTFSKEIEREFPEVQQLVDELYGRLSSANAALDAVFERETIWPPGTLWERWETNRALANVPLGVGETAQHLLAKFPSAHPYRNVALLPALFASDLDPRADLTALSLARLHGSWIRGLFTPPEGHDDLESFLLERIRAHGGECRLESRVASLIVRRGRVSGIWEEGEDEPMGTEALVSSEPGYALMDLAEGQGVPSVVQQRWPRLSVAGGRFVCNLVLKSRGLPEQLSQESFLLPPSNRLDDPAQPCLHLQRYPASEDETLLTAELLLPRNAELGLRDARSAALATLRFHFPFLDEHLLVVDSPHDGLPLHDYSQGSKRDIDRFQLTDVPPGAEPMETLWHIPPTGFLEVSGEPLRGPIKSTFLVGKSVLPGLGQEGEILAAWSVARLLTKNDAVRQRRRRQMWTKIETA